MGMLKSWTHKFCEIKRNFYLFGWWPLRNVMKQLWRGVLQVHVVPLDFAVDLDAFRFCVSSWTITNENVVLLWVAKCYTFRKSNGQRWPTFNEWAWCVILKYLYRSSSTTNYLLTTAPGLSEILCKKCT